MSPGVKSGLICVSKSRLRDKVSRLDTQFLKWYNLVMIEKRQTNRKGHDMTKEIKKQTVRFYGDLMQIIIAQDNNVESLNQAIRKGHGHDASVLFHDKTYTDGTVRTDCYVLEPNGVNYRKSSAKTLAAGLRRLRRVKRTRYDVEAAKIENYTEQRDENGFTDADYEKQQADESNPVGGKQWYRTGRGEGDPIDETTSHPVADKIAELTGGAICLCGCGFETGKGSQFRRGHDQRLVTLANDYVRSGDNIELTGPQFSYLVESGKLERARAREAARQTKTEAAKS